MHFFVTLTSGCNLKCSYCYGKCCNDIGADCRSFGEIDYSVPDEITYDIQLLKSFCERELIESLIFYGGEPLLMIDTVREIMDTLSVGRFIIHTNGILLDRLEARYVRKLNTVLVSLDGDEVLTDSYRGAGVYRQVMNNINLIRRRGFNGELIARMTVSEQTKIDEQVLHLALDTNIFDSVHWQLDAQFWHNDHDATKFSDWVTFNYGPRLKTLVGRWVDCMEDHGKVLRIYPLLGITESLLTRQASKLRCGAGWKQFNIQTDGTIVPCPAMSGMEDYYLGSIGEPSGFLDITKVSVGPPCTTCEILWICGGRCLYANITKLWGTLGFNQVCSTVRVLLSAVKSTLPRLRRLMEEGRISMLDFEYSRFNSCEIIP